MLAYYSNYLNQANDSELKNELKEIINKLNVIKEIDIHREIADRQKKAYNMMITNLNLLENSIIIEVNK